MPTKKRSTRGRAANPSPRRRSSPGASQGGGRARDIDLLCVLALSGYSLSAEEWLRRAQKALRPGRTAKDRISIPRLRALAEESVAKGIIRESEEARGRTGFGMMPAEARDVLTTMHAGGRLLPLYDEIYPASPHGSYRHSPSQVALQVALVTRSESLMADALRSARFAFGHGEGVGEIVVTALGTRPPAEDLQWLPEEPLRAYLTLVSDAAIDYHVPLGAAVVEAAVKRGGRLEQLAVGRYLALRSDADAITDLRKLRAVERLRLETILHALAGDAEAAYRAGEAAVTQRARLKQPLLDDLEAVFHALAAASLSHDNAEAWALVERYARLPGRRDDREAAALHLLDLLRGALLGDADAKRGLKRFASSPSSIGWIERMVLGCAVAWSGNKAEKAAVAKGLAPYLGARAQDICPRLSDFAQDIVHALEGEPTRPGSIVGSFHRKKAWELRLDALLATAEVPTSAELSGETRFAPYVLWDVTLESNGGVAIVPRHIRSEKSKKGTKIAVHRLATGDFQDATEADLRVVQSAEIDFDPWGSRSLKYQLNVLALPALVGHPHVRFDGEPVRVEAGEVGIVARSVKRGITVSLDPPEMDEEEIYFRLEEGGVLRVFELTPAAERFLRAVGLDEFVIPKEGADRLSRVLGALGADLRVRTEGDVHVAREEVEGATRPVVALARAKEGVSLRIAAAPFGVEGPFLPPGRGREESVWRHDAGVTCATRDLKAETVAVEAVREACPLLDALLDERHEGQSGDLVTALELLVELEAAGPLLTLAWPSGQSLKVPEKVEWGQVRASVQTAEQWMDVDLEVDVDESTVLGFRALMKHRIGASRYVEMDDGRVLELSSNIARSLDAMEGLGRSERTKSVQVSPPMLPLLQELIGEGALALDAGAKERLAAMRAALESSPRKPRSFRADLRDYQREGFAWMARLADAGLGAVLADDMGLGKTVQSLALLCRRARLGPQLIVAPTTVAPNWIDEARRFAPDLNLHPLATGNRDALLEEAGPGDVIVCSYGLLVREQERLGGLHFATAVFDEAHALKNSKSQRSRSASALRVDFRLSLTGTPVENHLGELWSLMQATLPGVLGSEARFQKRFVTPIERGERHAVADLREMLRPFVLRRTKAEVLDELPPRTEITHRVTPSAEARSFYEALRRESLERVANAGSGRGGAGRGRLQVLSEIQRLRQAAVDPRLVDAELGPPGAKYDALLELLEPLREEGHRAIVFSQFLGSQRAIRERLDAAKITHLSLDGSTPSATRKRRIDAFQNGEADVFVMSLKAGGVGVNLTGADYVFHLDPWWNPAVEDQATGRAHRIGQRRAVTVYRLITVDTIEEKILQLHDQKRELASDLLEGMGEATKLSVEDLKGFLGA